MKPISKTRLTLCGLIFTALTSASQAKIILSQASGSIQATTTWDTSLETPPTDLTAPPVAGDSNTWDANGRVLFYDGVPFFGSLFILGAGSTLQSDESATSPQGADPAFKSFTFDGGTVSYTRDSPSVFSFGVDRVFVTAAGGRIQSNKGNGNRDLWFDGGVWKGSGELVFSNPTASDFATSTALSSFRFTSTANLSAFTGTLSAIDKAVLEIACPVTTPTFTLNVMGTARYSHPSNADIVVRSLILNGTTLPPGTYRRGNGSLTPAQEALILSSGSITVASTRTAGVFPDTNGNGVNDFAEINNLGVDLTLPMFKNRNLDSDRDGQTDFQEFISKTDPVIASSFISCKILNTTATAVTLGFYGNKGVSYQLQWSPDLAGWASYGSPQLGTDASDRIRFPFASLAIPDPKKLFFRIAVTDSDNFTEWQDSGTDSDRDGVTDAMERTTQIFDPTKPDSMRSAGNGGDRKHMRELFRGVNLSESLTDTTYAASISPENAARFLFQAGMGANEADIVAVQNLGYAGWIDQQLTLPAYIDYNAYMKDIKKQFAELSNAYPDSALARIRVPYDAINNQGFPLTNLDTSFMRSVVHGDDILRQKSVWALLQIIVSSSKGFLPRWGEPCAAYVEIFQKQCFGRYEDLLYAVSTNGHMGSWLTFINNKKADLSIQRFPDENYAREIMQLFTIGLYEMNLDGTYKTDAAGRLISTYGFKDIETLAKSFTGLKGTLDGTTPSNNTDLKFTDKEMVAYEPDHDTTAKSLLGGYLTIPAGMTTKNEVRLVCQKLVQHPNCAPFVSIRLIQNLVTSNPSPAYVKRISQVFRNTDGNLGQVIKAILLDPEARGPRFLTDPSFGKLREPMMRFTNIARAFEVGSEVNPEPYSLDNLQFYRSTSFSTQGFFNAPSVFNYFSSDYQESGAIEDAQLLSPEFQLLTATTNLSSIEEVKDKLTTYLHRPSYDYGRGNIRSEPTVRFRYLKEIGLMNDAATQGLLVDRLSTLMTGGLADAAARADYRQPIFSTPDPSVDWTRQSPTSRVIYSILKLYCDPSCSIQR